MELAVGAACLFPLALLLLLSLAPRWPYPEIWPSQAGLQAWGALLGGGSDLLSTLGVSLLLSASVAMVATVGGWLAARWIAYHPARRRLALLAYAPYVLSPVVLGVCLLYLYLRVGVAGTFVGVGLAHLTFAGSFAVVFFLGFWSAEKRALAELVRTLGGSTWQLYARVLLPMSRGALLLCLFQTFLVSWFQYGLTVLVGGGAVRTLPLRVFDFLAEANLAFAAVASLLLVLPPVVLLLVNRRLFLRPI